MWHTSKCFTPFVPGESHDISAAVTNLFAMHNRMHDWSYNLGFTEEHWNAQESNLGNGGPGTAENDRLIGDAQAGARDGGFPSYLGRDNANMVPLPDGVRPITNMYLWQPIAGTFYAPCVDGDFDKAVIGHEFGHLVENRMIGKGGTRAGHHAGAMGESSGDLTGVEYLNEYGFVPVSGESPFAVGSYATGNKVRAIRNYDMSYPRTGAFPDAGRNGAADRPAQLQRHGLRPHRRAGARRRRDLERDELRHPAGARREVQRRRPGGRTRRSSASAPTACGRREAARATGAGSRSCSTRTC